MKQFYSPLRVLTRPDRKWSKAFSLAVLLLSCFPLLSKAGSFNITNGAIITSCSDYFYDPGRALF
ncbi:MAG: hypothetical protein QM743_11780 [Chitinophagaceae bacterium]